MRPYQTGNAVIQTFNTKNGWMIIEEQETPTHWTTRAFKVFSKKRDQLGVIQWFPPFRKYAFIPTSGTVYDLACLKDLCDFLEKIGREHKGNYS